MNEKRKTIVVTSSLCYVATVKMSAHCATAKVTFLITTCDFFSPYKGRPGILTIRKISAKE